MSTLSDLLASAKTHADKLRINLAIGDMIRALEVSLADGFGDAEADASRPAAEVTVHSLSKDVEFLKGEITRLEKKLSARRPAAKKPAAKKTT